MDDHRFADDLLDAEFIGKKAHFSITVMGKKHRKIAGMVAMGLMMGIPMPSCPLEGIFRIPHMAISHLMEMKTMGANGWLAVLSRLIRW